MSWKPIILVFLATTSAIAAGIFNKDLENLALWSLRFVMWAAIWSAVVFPVGMVIDRAAKAKIKDVINVVRTQNIGQHA
jgi:hypothetical protein